MSKKNRELIALKKFLKRYWKSNEKEKMMIELKLFKNNMTMYEWIKNTKDWSQENKDGLIKELEKQINENNCNI